MIIGKDILPRGTGIVTRRPTIVQLFNIARGLPEHAIFSHKPNVHFSDFQEVKQEIMKEMITGAGRNLGISPIPIVVKIYSPIVPNLSLVDLPGLTKVPVGDQPSDIENRIKKMVLEQIKNPNSIILAITAANQDIACSDSLNIARSVDPHGERTMGVLTKMDKFDDSNQILSILRGELAPLSLGYVGVRCRSQQDINNRVSMAQAIQIEKQFFESSNLFRDYTQNLTIPRLTEKLNIQLMSTIKKTFPQIKKKLKKLIIQKQKDRKKFGMVLNFTKSNDSKGALLVSVINKFCKLYSQSLKGEFFTKELSGGAKINEVLVKFKTETMALKPFKGTTNKELGVLISNMCGLNQSLIISDHAFEKLCQREIIKFKKPAFQCLNKIYQELKMLILKLKIDELEVLTNARTAIINEMTSAIDSCYRPTEEMIKMIFEVEEGHINIKNPQFANLRKLILSKFYFFIRQDSLIDLNLANIVSCILI